ncbi:GNAT family N-acetyltransferase [Pantoea ananatis]|uniref:GNAT family N-acetyltransferase n=2 Tax=Pantoea ananas TaxID=553 RepID=UPI0015994907|nr:GNAT family N-acetyltransferase [Pantoea ananatis]MCW1832216.1 GNAT family N-acetyltransferase [Pantoea ananatis]QKV85674.1 GNAT family N-acetyltransferase [Pantoea ananatis]
MMSGRIPGNSQYPYLHNNYQSGSDRPPSRQANTSHNTQSSSAQQRPPSRSGYGSMPVSNLPSSMTQRPPSRSGTPLIHSSIYNNTSQRFPTHSGASSTTPYAAYGYLPQRPPSRTGHVQMTQNPMYADQPEPHPFRSGHSSMPQYPVYADMPYRAPSRSGHLTMAQNSMYANQVQRTPSRSSSSRVPPQPIFNQTTGRPASRSGFTTAAGTSNTSHARSIASTSSDAFLQPTFRKLNLNSREDQLKLKDFIMSLDQDSYEKRFGDFPREANRVDLYKNDESIGLFRGGKLVGLADYFQDLDSREKSAYVNMVISRSAQGLGLGKRMMEIRDQHLINEGYKYKLGNVFINNTSQIQRLLKNGWQITERDDEFVTFRKKI